MVILLLGRFKNESGERWHILLRSSDTASGFKLRIWIERLMMLLLRERNISGPVFCDKGGVLVASSAMKNFFIQESIKVNKEREDLVLCDLDQIWDLYNIWRYFRRGSKT